MEHIDSNISFEKPQSFYNKNFRSAEVLVACKNVLDDLIKLKTISKTKCNTLHRHLYLSKNWYVTVINQ